MGWSFWGRLKIITSIYHPFMLPTCFCWSYVKVKNKRGKFVKRRVKHDFLQPPSVFKFMLYVMNAVVSYLVASTAVAIFRRKVSSYQILNLIFIPIVSALISLPLNLFINKLYHFTYVQNVRSAILNAFLPKVPPKLPPIKLPEGFTFQDIWKILQKED